MKYCSHCGSEVQDDAIYCPNCGELTSGSSSYGNQSSNGFAIAAFICSFFIPLLGWIFGGIGISKANKMNGKGKGLAIAGIIIATISFIWSFYVYSTILKEILSQF